jgi:hypothetical protein
VSLRTVLKGKFPDQSSALVAVTSVCGSYWSRRDGLTKFSYHFWEPSETEWEILYEDIFPESEKIASKLIWSFLCLLATGAALVSQVVLGGFHCWEGDGVNSAFLITGIILVLYLVA